MAEPRRVLHLDAEPGYRGGQRQLRLLLAEQRRDPGLAPRAWVRSSRLRAELRDLGVWVERWPGMPRAWLALRRDRSIDLIHAHDARSHGLARSAGWPSSGRPLVVHRRIDDPPRSRPTTRWKYRGGIFVCVSAAAARALEDLGVPHQRLRVVHSAVPLGPTPPPPTPHGPSLRLVAVGALVEHKGHCDLLDALARCRHPHSLVLAGEGPLRRRLTDRAAGLGLGARVSLVGDVGDARNLILQADALVHPSRSEGLGTAVLDAQALGRPVIASRVGGLPEICDEATGALCPPGDPVALAACIDALGELSARDRAAFVAMGLRGRQRVLRDHRPEALGRAVRAVYDGLE